MMLLKPKNTSSYLIAQILRFGSLLLINIIMAKSHLSLADLGRFESFTFYASAISFFWITGFSQTLLSLSETNPDSWKNKSLIYSTFILFLGFSTVCSLLLFVGNSIHQEGLIPGLKPSDNLMFSSYLLFYPIGFLIEFILLINRHYKSLIVYAVLSFILTMLIVPLPVISGFGVEYGFFGLIILAVVKVILLFFMLKHYSSISIDKSLIVKLIKTGLPLILTALIAGSAFYIDGLIISLKFDNQTFAIFRYGAREFPLFLLISSSFGMSVIPMITNPDLLSSNLKFIKEKSAQFIRQLFPLAILLLALSQYAFQFLFNENFYKSYIIFDIYLLLVISRFVFPAALLMGFQKNKLIFLVSIIELVINVTFSLLFVQWIGFTGIAYGTVVAYISEKLVLIVLVKDKLNISPKEYIPIKELLIFSSIMIIVFAVKFIIINS